MNPVNQGNLLFVVSPDAALTDALSALLGLFGTRVHIFSDVESFLAAYSLNDADRSCLLVEADLPALSGLALVSRLRSLGFKQPTIVLSNHVDHDLRQRALYCGATEIIEKPLVNRFVHDHLTMVMPNARFAPGVAAHSTAVGSGSKVTFRVMRPDDADMVQAFVRELSDESRYMRFFSGIHQLTPSMLENFTHPNYPRNCALIATVFEDARERAIATARYEPTAVEHAAEYAVVVADDWHRLGIASQLMRGLITVAAVAGVELLQGLVLRGNQRMLKLAYNLGFAPTNPADDGTIVITFKHLRQPRRPIGYERLASEDNGRAMAG